MCSICKCEEEEEEKEEEEEEDSRTNDGQIPRAHRNSVGLCSFVRHHNFNASINPPGRPPCLSAICLSVAFERSY